VSYFVQRMCSTGGDYNSAGNSCSIAPAAVDCGNSKRIDSNGGAGNLNCPTQIYYRITVRVDGPRNTSSYTQAMVAL
jgi:type IV pilus assembly protein PilX